MGVFMALGQSQEETELGWLEAGTSTSSDQALTPGLSGLPGRLQADGIAFLWDWNEN